MTAAERDITLDGFSLSRPDAAWRVPLLFASSIRRLSNKSATPTRPINIKTRNHNMCTAVKVTSTAEHGSFFLEIA